MTLFEVFQLVVNLALVPAIGTIFSLHGRISKIEGMMHIFTRKDGPK